MKKIVLSILLLLPLVAVAQGSSPQADAIRWCGDTLYINTTTLCPDVKGYNGITPVELAIVNRKVSHVTILPNRETRSYFRNVTSRLAHKWDGQVIEDGIALKVDGVSGATYSSLSVIQNVRYGLQVAQQQWPKDEWKPSPALLIAGTCILLILLLTIYFFKRKKQK